MTAAAPGTERAGARMLSEMGEQPEVVGRLLDRRAGLHAAIRAACPSEPRGIVLFARGSSDHAALYGRYVLETAVGRPVSLGAPSLWTRYDLSEDLTGHIAIGLSQSGQTGEIAMTLDRVGACGATTIAITNDADSPLASAANLVLALEAGAETAVPATKTVTAQFAMLAVIAEALGGEAWSNEQWSGVAAGQREVLLDLDAALPAAELVARSRGSIHLSRGHALAVAHECALKIAECTGIPSLAYAAPDYLHGPIATAAPDMVVVCYATPGPTYEDIATAMSRAGDAGSPVVAIGATGSGADISIPTVGGLPEQLAPLVLVTRGQQIAYHAARVLGLDPDAPKGLTKVTQTK